MRLGCGLIRRKQNRSSESHGQLIHEIKTMLAPRLPGLAPWLPGLPGMAPAWPSPPCMAPQGPPYVSNMANMPAHQLPDLDWPLVSWHLEGK